MPGLHPARPRDLKMSDMLRVAASSQGQERNTLERGWDWWSQSLESGLGSVAQALLPRLLVAKGTCCLLAWLVSYLFVCLFVCKGGGENKEKSIDLLFTGSLPKCSQQLGLDQAEARSLHLHPGLPSGWQGLKYFSRYLLPQR